ncbi:MAG: DNRLRE domain-containing protein [Verrucomicrobia bacterium]|nr:DNRLRE domain-containing protein [Verrucomicrobiota bacterium]
MMNRAMREHRILKKALGSAVGSEAPHRFCVRTALPNSGVSFRLSPNAGKSLSCMVACMLLTAFDVHSSVYEVDQPATADTNQWTYTVGETGDYQIGLAWVETQSGGDVAVEIFKNGLERIKALYAPAGEVTRFEMRIEELYPGDEIAVKLTPNGSTYRAGYQIAFGTPTFDDLPVFDVATYGAVGDGVTDDMAAIRAAVTDARNAGGGIVRLDGSKTYRSIGLTDLTVERLFDLNGAHDLKIEGNGATILLHPPDGLAGLHDCENVQIDGLRIDYDPIPYYQGTITDINVANLTIDIDVPERYPVPMVGTNSNPKPFFGRSFVPDYPGARSGWGDNIYVESTAVNGDPRSIRIQVPTTANGVPMQPRVQDAYDNNATEFVVPHLLYGHRDGATKIHSCSRVKLSNLHYVRMAYFWLSIQHNTGPITLSNVDLKMTEPETELLASWRDGMHIKNGRWGILIENGDWDGAAQYDDTFAIYTRRQVVVSVAGNKVTLKPSVYDRESWLWQAGDWASFWSADQETLRGMARVVSVQDLTAPNYEVTFESVPAGVSANDVVLHEESLNRGTLVRNCSTSDIGTETASTRLRGTDMRFENNHFDDFSFRLEWSSTYGTPRARDVVVENSYLSSPEGSLVLDRPLGVLFKNCVIDGLEAQVRQGADNVYFDGVVWSNMTGNIMDVVSDSHVWIFGNTTRNGSASGLSAHVSKDGSSTVTYAAPAGYPDPVPPGPSDFSHALGPVADSYVRDGAASENYGTEEYLRCKYDSGGNFTRQSYLRFDLSDVHGAVKRAVLRLKVVSVNGSGDTHTAHGVDDDSWGENAITWSNRPALGPPFTSAAHGGVGDWVEFDVTDAVDASDDLFSVALVSDGSALVGYGSRESISNAPQLVVQASWSYGAWSNQYQLAQGPDGDDDLDGRSNIEEYAFGGNPTNELDTGSALELSLSGDNTVLVHAERTAADSGLLYTVESTDNLVSNIWAEVDPGSAVVSNGWKTVTHFFPTLGKDQQFLRLKAELQ